MHWIIVGLLIGFGLMLAPMAIALVAWVISWLVITLCWAIVAACVVLPWTIIPLIILSPLFPDPSLPLGSAVIISVLTLLGWLSIRIETWKEKRKLKRDAQREAEHPKYPIYTSDHYGNPIAIREDGSTTAL